MSDFVPLYGNYRGYYSSKRPFAKDDRLSLLPSAIFQGARVLDVGCNEGWITCEIAQSLGAKHVTGVDIDDALVRAAWKRRRVLWSQQRPQHPEANEANVESSTAPLENSYFPASLAHTFGPLPIPPMDPSGVDADTFPHNVTFRTADWVTTAIPEDKAGYDVVLALSVSKWIHLHNGDSGLKQFFNRVYTVLKPGGCFILEPQDWESYSKAKRMDPTLKEKAKTLQFRPHQFAEVLEEMGFDEPERVGTPGQQGFQRVIDIYRK